MMWFAATDECVDEIVETRRWFTVHSIIVDEAPPGEKREYERLLEDIPDDKAGRDQAVAAVRKFQIAYMEQRKRASSDPNKVRY